MSFASTSTPVILWSNTDCIAWIDSLTTVSKEIKDTLHVKIAANPSFVGENLLEICGSAQSIAAEIVHVLPNVKALDCKRVCKAMKAVMKSFRENPNSIYTMVNYNWRTTQVVEWKSTDVQGTHTHTTHTLCTQCFIFLVQHGCSHLANVFLNRLQILKM